MEHNSYDLHNYKAVFPGLPQHLFAHATTYGSGDDRALEIDDAAVLLEGV